MTKTEFIKTQCSACSHVCGTEKCAPYYACEAGRVEPVVADIVNCISEIERACKNAQLGVFSISISPYTKDIFMDMDAVNELSAETGIRVEDGCMYYANVRIIGGK